MMYSIFKKVVKMFCVANFKFPLLPGALSITIKFGTSLFEIHFIKIHVKRQSANLDLVSEIRVTVPINPSLWPPSTIIYLLEKMSIGNTFRSNSEQFSTITIWFLNTV